MLFCSGHLEEKRRESKLRRLFEAKRSDDFRREISTQSPANYCALSAERGIDAERRIGETPRVRVGARLEHLSKLVSVEGRGGWG